MTMRRRGKAGRPVCLTREEMGRNKKGATMGRSEGVFRSNGVKFVEKALAAYWAGYEHVNLPSHQPSRF